MKLYKLLLLIAIFVTNSIVVEAKNDNAKLDTAYIFGFAIPLDGGTIYITDIQKLKVYHENNHSRFLIDRDDYAYQLRDYLTATTKEELPTCVILFAYEEKDAIKKYLKLIKNYTNKKIETYPLIKLTPDKFKFKTVEINQ